MYNRRAPCVRAAGAGCKASALHGAHVAGWLEAEEGADGLGEQEDVQGRAAGAPPRLGSLGAVEPGALLQALRGGAWP